MRCSWFCHLTILIDLRHGHRLLKYLKVTYKLIVHVKQLSWSFSNRKHLCKSYLLPVLNVGLQIYWDYFALVSIYIFHLYISGFSLFIVLYLHFFLFLKTIYIFFKFVLLRLNIVKKAQKRIFYRISLFFTLETRNITYNSCEFQFFSIFLMWFGKEKISRHNYLNEIIACVIIWKFCIRYISVICSILVNCMSVKALNVSQRVTLPLNIFMYFGNLIRMEF